MNRRAWTLILMNNKFIDLVYTKPIYLVGIHFMLVNVIMLPSCKFDEFIPDQIVGEEHCLYI